MDRSLSLWDRLSVRIHQWVCPPCNQIRHQFDAIRKACRMISAETEETRWTNKDSIVMPEDVNKRIKAALKEQIK
jgi:hypothetical protein